jgi:hypothetical protein
VIALAVPAKAADERFLRGHLILHVEQRTPAITAPVLDVVSRRRYVFRMCELSDDVHFCDPTKWSEIVALDHKTC